MDKVLYNIPPKNVQMNMWLCFPAIQSFGLSSLGYMSIVKMFDKRTDYYVEKVFTDSQPVMTPDNVDLMGFSVSFEMDFLGILKILENNKIPFKANERDGNLPLIFGGGPVLTANPEPYADLFDFIIIGDAENMDESVFDLIKNNKNLTKSEILYMLSLTDGIYVPSLKNNNTAVKKISAKLGECISTPVLSENSFFENTYVIEIVRGCPRRCGFCLASYLNLPVRFCSYEEIIKSIDEGLKYTNKIALLGALISAHPQFEKICYYILQKQKMNPSIELSVSSLRADSVSPLVIQMLVNCGQKHSTIAIEAATDRLRKVINKNLNDLQIFETVKTAQENGLKGLKLYSMIGLPTETDEDVRAFVELAKKLKNTFKNFEFTFSFGTFVPKAHTPFQFCDRQDTRTLEKKYEYLKKEFHKIGVKLRTSSVKWDFWQAVLSRGDRRLCDLLIEVYKNGGSLGAFKQSYKELCKKGVLPPAEDYGLSGHRYDDILPWDFLKIEPEKEVLIKENQRLTQNLSV